MLQACGTDSSGSTFSEGFTVLTWSEDHYKCTGGHDSIAAGWTRGLGQRIRACSDRHSGERCSNQIGVMISLYECHVVVSKSWRLILKEWSLASGAMAFGP